jgi:hypothetical protein
VTNVVGTATYFTPRVSNPTSQNVSIALYNGGTVRCLGTQGNGSTTTWGYYLLGSTTELRYYAPGTVCTGNFVVVSRSTLASSMAPNSGLVALTNPGVP